MLKVLRGQASALASFADLPAFLEPGTLVLWPMLEEFGMASVLAMRCGSAVAGKPSWALGVCPDSWELVFEELLVSDLVLS